MKSQKDPRRINGQRVSTCFRQGILSMKNLALQKMNSDSSENVVDIWNFIKDQKETCLTWRYK